MITTNDGYGNDDDDNESMLMLHEVERDNL